MGKLSKNEYLSKLKVCLKNLPEEDRNEIIYDYEEHFRIGIEKGKTEADIAQSLGSPEILAREFKVSFAVNQAEQSKSTENIFKAVFATVSLGFFNLIFVLGPFLAVLGVVLGFFIAAIGISIAGIILFSLSIFNPGYYPWWISIPGILMVNPIGTMFLGLGFACLGLLLLIFTITFAKFVYQLMIQYLKFNVKIISGRREKNESWN